MTWSIKLRIYHIKKFIEKVGEGMDFKDSIFLKTLYNNKVHKKNL